MIYLGVFKPGSAAPFAGCAAQSVDILYIDILYIDITVRVVPFTNHWC